MMQINRSTDYAIRAIVHLAKESNPVSSSKLSAVIGVSSRYLMQIGAKLRDADFVTVTHGPSGGYELKQPPNRISLYDIITTMENPGEKQHKQSGDEFQMLEHAYDYIDTILIKLLKSITIESFLNRSDEQWFLASYLLR